MAEQNTMQKVQEQIKQLKDIRKQDLLKIQIELNEAQAELKAADLDIKKATESMDYDAYEAAIRRKNRAQFAIDMYSGRYRQLEDKEYISEEESDRVIDSLLAYEEEITAKFEENIKVPLKTLEKLQADYEQEIDAIETTMRTWQGDIHANYNTRGATMYKDEKTGKMTYRSNRAIPVHRTRYEGSEASQLLRDILTGRLSSYVKE